MGKVLHVSGIIWLCVLGGVAIFHLKDIPGMIGNEVEGRWINCVAGVRG